MWNFCKYMFIKYNLKCIIIFYNNVVFFLVKYLIILIKFLMMLNVNIMWFVFDMMVGFLFDYFFVMCFKIEKVKFLYLCVNVDI